MNLVIIIIALTIQLALVILVIGYYIHKLKLSSDEILSLIRLMKYENISELGKSLIHIMNTVKAHLIDNATNEEIVAYINNAVDEKINFESQTEEFFIKK